MRRFLRIRDGKELLDASSVHPEACGVAKKIVAACGRDLRTLMGDSAVLKSVDPRQFIDDKFGLPTVKDILSELKSPPRPAPELQDRDLRRGHQRDFRPEAGHDA